MREKVRELLESGRVDVVLAYREVDGHPLPWSFTPDNLEDLEHLATGPARYPLDKIAGRLAKFRPELRIGLLARECTQRGLNLLASWNQLDPDKIETLEVGCCPSQLHNGADCSHLVPEKVGAHKKEIGIDNRLRPEDLEELSQSERYRRWSYEFSKCIKCYGCRNICPVCFCTECSLENQELISGKSLPPEMPIFHLARAAHMAGRCIDCGLCEEACPMDIPLRLLYAQVGRIVGGLFDYRPGTDGGVSPFTFLGEKVTLEIKPLEEAQEA